MVDLPVYGIVHLMHYTLIETAPIANDCLFLDRYFYHLCILFAIRST